jgi:Na+/H+ antiporter NhaC
MMNYWNRRYDSDDRSLWTHARNNHCYLASVGYKAGHHFVQGLFARRFFIPEVSDFLMDETAPTTALKYDAGSYNTCLAHQGVVRYSYQQQGLTIAYYLVRQSLSFSECMDCLPEGFKQMVPAMLILTFAWTLKSMTDNLGAATFVAGLVANSADGLMGLLPAIIFVVATGLAFASGTSWATFGILIPIVVSCFQDIDPQLMIISISACMAGAVAGDHCSPISDTTIMSSAGAQCEHMNHVTTQLPYVMTTAAVSFLTFLVAGFTKSAVLSLAFGIVALFLLLMFIRRKR